MNFRLAFIAFLSLTSFVHAVPPELDPQKDLPRIPAVEPENALKTFQIKKGFHVELVASEPNVIDPVALSFDENGKMFVVEMNDYSERRDEKLGRIRVLEDTDGDGKFDKATVLADKLPWPTGIICYDGGVFVASSPDIIYLKDTNGDGKADERKICFTGFGNTKDRLNVQALLNSFNWGLDNRIHGATAPNGGIVTNLIVKGRAPLNLSGRDFCFDLHTMELFAENGGGQYGFSYDSKGRKFVCSNSHHIQTMMYDGRYAERNPFYAMPGALVDIAVDGPAAEVYRISPEEPWRVIRTKWRVSGIASGPIEGGGRSAGYFTGATGITIYRGAVFPKDFRDNAFIGDAGGNLVHRKKIYEDGVGVIAKRPDDEQKVEFMASKDTWFRPVQFANAPDGTLYVIDMYREVIEHPWSLPEQIKKHLDLNSGNDRGRIYRIAPDNFQQPKPVQLGSATTKELVATLNNPNGWHRDTAARLLYQRQDKSAVPLLRELLGDKKSSALGRLHALHALQGLGALTQEDGLTACKDADEIVRVNGVQLLEPFLKKPSSYFTTLARLAVDPSIHVRYQLAFTLGEITSANYPARVSNLLAIIKQDPTNSWIQAAVFSSLAEGSGEMFTLAVADPSMRVAGKEFLRQLVELIGAKNNPGEVTMVLNYLPKVNDAGLSFSLLRALGDGLKRAGTSLEKLSGNFDSLFKRAAVVAAEEHADESTRIQAIQLLAISHYGQSGKTLVSLLEQNQSQAVQLAAVDSLGHFSDPAVGTDLSQRFSSMTPQVRSATLAVLLARPERVRILLDTMDKGTVRPSDLSSSQIKFLKNHHDASIKAKAAKIFANVGTARRADVVESFQSALTLSGNAAHGKAIYTERCSSCHRLEGVGFALGPDLVTVKNSGKEKMLANILDPNREVAPNYKAFEVETKDDESFIGLIANETATSVTLRQAFGKENVILRSQIKKLQSQENSLMPEGLEAGLKPQDLADLIDYISNANATK